jgi:hypothetical protein
MRTLALGLALAILLAPAARAQTEGLTVGYMLPICEVFLGLRHGDTQTQWEAALCAGTALGVAQVMSLNCSSREAEGMSPHPDLSAAMPPNRAAGVQAWINWARANPEEWNTNFEASFINAYAEAFPCPNSSPLLRRWRRSRPMTSLSGRLLGSG